MLPWLAKYAACRGVSGWSERPRDKDDNTLPVRVPEDMPKITPPEPLQVHAIDKLYVLQHIALAYVHTATTVEGRLFLIFVTVSATLWLLDEDPLFVMEIWENCDDGPASDTLRRNMARVRLLGVRERLLPLKSSTGVTSMTLTACTDISAKLSASKSVRALRMSNVVSQRSPARFCASRRLVLGELRSHIPSQS